ncbi:bifunctional folylpolyglutamate synthase/dihydrofolate synthase [Bacillus alkalisoli]|uniref:bifunctional folylpolyglutamate synthase/dihydrofolate synthase n=1 Tax=Bacillus alkalisoli TaxID=2011008 RepID=UPI000C23758E|nr:folylpolyglutamate synthase/dihydrofolate synthase family protein [Bacillus alkalisoli]
MYKDITKIAEKLLLQSGNKIELGLSRMNEFLQSVANPQEQLKCIHVGGTNGKGSTVKYLEGMLMESGLTVGVFHSPYYEAINDQITVNGTYISDEEIHRIIKHFETTVKTKITEFELLTAIALYYFSSVKKVDIALIEVGMGGEDDSTNVVEPIVSIITNVGMDHADFLGNSLVEIANKKAGIIKRGVPLVSSVSQEELRHLLKNKCVDFGCDSYFLKEEFKVESINQDTLGETFNFIYKDQTIENIYIPLTGEHQIQNAALAVMTYLLLKDKQMVVSNEQHMKKGLKNVSHAGRFEIMSTSPTIILDGAHNLEAVEMLVKTIQHKFSNKDITIVFSAFKDKPIREMVNELTKLGGKIIFTTVPSPRNISAKEQYNIAGITKASYEENCETVVKQEILNCKQHNNLLVITGSLHFISIVRKYLLDLSKVEK